VGDFMTGNGKQSRHQLDGQFEKKIFHNTSDYYWSVFVA
jgi:hypothetical protein